MDILGSVVQLQSEVSQSMALLITSEKTSSNSVPSAIVSSTSKHLSSLSLPSSLRKLVGKRIQSAPARERPQMASEKAESESDTNLENFLQLESANNDGQSLESVHSASPVTQIEVASHPKLVEASTDVVQEDAKVKDQSSLLDLVADDVKNEMQSDGNTKSGVDGESQEGAKKESTCDDIHSTPEAEGDDREFDQSYEDDTISSEAVVDDIELILMPEIVQEFPAGAISSPQLVRVTELSNRQRAEYESEVFEDDDETDQESDFKKFAADDEEGMSERSVSSRTKPRRKVILSSSDDGQGPSTRNYGSYLKQDDKKSNGKVSSGVQTDLTALETASSALPSEEFRRRSGGKSIGTMSSTHGKRLNWKSELTLLPSKTKIQQTGMGFSGFESIHYQDQYSPRVVKFTSQDMLSSSMNPTMLYRTRNLSRNLNQCDESTLALPAAGLPLTSTSQSQSSRYRERITSSTSSNFKESPSSQHIGSSVPPRRQLFPSVSTANFRSSLPDLSHSPRGVGDHSKVQRRSFRSMKGRKTSSGHKLTKKSSSEDDTSSLIDESERCLRSSIDLLLTDDLPSPAADLSCRSAVFATTSSSHSHGRYASRRSSSQPILIGEDDSDDHIRDASMGSPFLPRKLSDMRCSKWAKCILPNGHVAVVAVKEINEVKETLTINTDTGCTLSLPFRKVVFAWKLRR